MTTTGRFELAAAEAVDGGDFAADVRAGLEARPRRLSCRWFYDAEGSRLFEAICGVPEYYPPRAEREILERRAAEILDRVGSVDSVWEFGSGSAVKTRLLLEPLLREGPATYVAVDISRSALEESAASLLGSYPSLRVLAVHGDYEEGLRRLSGWAQPKLLLWLGSNVGNFDRAEAARFLRRVREALGPADRLLLGVDLRKERATLEAAYDDAQGVTAAFNLNLLARINRELGGQFDLAGFRHLARYDVVRGCVDMFLVSRRAQRVRIEGLDLELSFEPGEEIHTESSHKYSREELAELALASELRIDRLWTDDDGRFADLLLAPSDG